MCGRKVAACEAYSLDMPSGANMYSIESGTFVSVFVTEEGFVILAFL